MFFSRHEQYAAGLAAMLWFGLFVVWSDDLCWRAEMFGFFEVVLGNDASSSAVGWTVFRLN